MAGIIGSSSMPININGWYTILTRPELAPPNWVFGPVWIVLYTLMGFAAFLIWERRKFDPRATLALWVYGVHLVLNAVWSLIFFGMQNPRLAFFEILLLDVFAVATIVLFWRISKPAGLILLPYVTWLFFATYLNYTFWVLN